MTIDIITYTDEQFAALSEEQLLEVKTAQQKKDKMFVTLQENKEKEKHRLIKNGVFLSGVWAKYCEKLDQAYLREVDALREALLFYLRFSSRPSGGSTEGSHHPYEVNYAYTIEERLTIVKTYYESAYQSARDRFAAFAEDQVAPVYLGEAYKPLYDYFLAAVE